MRGRILEWANAIFGETWAALLFPDQPVLSSLGGLLAVLIAMLWGRREGLSWWRVALAGGAAALVGSGMARVFWAITSYEAVLKEPYLLIDPYRGGATSFGALAGGALGAALAAWLLRLPLWRLADVMLPPGLFGIAFARVGCLMRGCDYGTPSDLPWSVRYPYRSSVWLHHYGEDWIERSDRLSLPVHPFPIYLAVWCVAVFLLAWRRPHLFGDRPGQRALGTGLLWLAGRFLLELLRQPGNAPQVVGPFNMGQALALLGIVVFALLYLRTRRPEARGAA